MNLLHGSYDDILLSKRAHSREIKGEGSSAVITYPLPHLIFFNFVKSLLLKIFIL